MSQSQVSTWPTYEPTKVEQETVAYLQSHGAPKEVYYIDRGEGASSPVSRDYHEMWFFKSELEEYHGESKSIVKNPELTLVEMRSAGVLSI